ncbi:uncharacterized protein (DUF433 family) [Sinorhizobium kostiense]|uniref:Uncharacterized protein (DUF433 family) n=1 Tax=Sinorhizobium kostiense TaxID=76747 RepID=A0ABS4R1Z0_9HYPH|nr:uncharacterized protein (DUF433 family) [Sinorhizobium kostiense]
MRRLTSEERLFAIKTAGARLDALRALEWAALLRQDWTVRDEFLTIDLLPFVNGTSERLDDLAAAREVVSTSPDALGGTPVIRGTRVPVYDVAASVAAGHPVERILDTWPSLDAEMVRLAVIYAEANPLRGRPRVSGDLPEGSTIYANRRVARRRKAPAAAGLSSESGAGLKCKTAGPCPHKKRDFRDNSKSLLFMDEH